MSNKQFESSKYSLICCLVRLKVTAQHFKLFSPRGNGTIPFWYFWVRNFPPPSRRNSRSWAHLVRSGSHISSKSNKKICNFLSSGRTRWSCMFLNMSAPQSGESMVSASSEGHHIAGQVSILALQMSNFFKLGQFIAILAMWSPDIAWVSP